jgi:hypothetical protein
MAEILRFIRKTATAQPALRRTRPPCQRQNLLWLAGNESLPPSLKSEFANLKSHSPVLLMGGEELFPAKRKWHFYPHYGPFRLALLEAIFRAPDIRASKESFAE